MLGDIAQQRDMSQIGGEMGLGRESLLQSVVARQQPPITEASQLLRGLVQQVLSPGRSLGDNSEA